MADKGKRQEYPKMIIVGDKRVKVNDAVEEAKATGKKIKEVKEGNDKGDDWTK